MPLHQEPVLWLKRALIIQDLLGDLLLNLALFFHFYEGVHEPS